MFFSVTLWLQLYCHLFDEFCVYIYITFLRLLFYVHFFCVCVVVFIFLCLCCCLYIFCVCVLLCLYFCVCVVVSGAVGSSRSGGHSCYNSYKQPPCSRRFDIQRSFIYSTKIILTDTAGKVDPFILVKLGPMPPSGRRT